MTPDSWKNRLWEELDTLPVEDQFAVANEWITYASRILLGDLAQRRRLIVINLLKQPGATNASVAEHLGLRRSTVVRLVEEGRASLKEAERAAEPLQEEILEEGLLSPHPSV